MTVDVTRRALLASALPAWWLAGCATRMGTELDLNAPLTALQARTGGKLGVFVQDTGTGDFIGFNAESRFALCSTFKLLLAAAVLQRVDAGNVTLDQTLTFGRRDLLAYAPVTSRRVAEGRMSVRDLLAASVELSDNTAANLLLGLVGGPSAATDFARGLGDFTTRLDRLEPDLNANLPGDLRDTTTPLAMNRTLQAVLLGDALTAGSQAHLTAWLVASPTGRRRIRSGLPDSWRIGDKTGSGENGAVNDVAVAWPTVGAPLVFAIYISGATAPLETVEAIHGAAARLAARELVSSAALQPSRG